MQSAPPTARTFYATNRGGGIYSEAISQRLGASIASIAYRAGIAPTALTMVNLVLVLGASIAMIALAPAMVAGSVSAWVVGLAALLAWQLGYAFDCSDGQLARVSGRTSPAGARVDVLCDVAAQIGLVTAVGAVAVAYRPSTPVWLVAAFAGTWMVNLVTSVMQSGASGASMVASTSLPVRVVKLVRDYGAVIFVIGLVLTLAPAWTVWVMVAFTAVNGLFLLASIAFSARASLR